MREKKRRWRVGLNFSLVGVVREDVGEIKKKKQHQHRNASFLLTAFVDTEEEMGRYGTCVFLFRNRVCKLRGRSARTPLVLAATHRRKSRFAGHNPSAAPPPN